MHVTDATLVRWLDAGERKSLDESRLAGLTRKRRHGAGVTSPDVAASVKSFPYLQTKQTVHVSDSTTPTTAPTATDPLVFLETYNASTIFPAYSTIDPSTIPTAMEPPDIGAGPLADRFIELVVFTVLIFSFAHVAADHNTATNILEAVASVNVMRFVSAGSAVEMSLALFIGVCGAFYAVELSRATAIDLRWWWHVTFSSSASSQPRLRKVADLYEPVATFEKVPAISTALVASGSMPLSVALSGTDIRGFIMSPAGLPSSHSPDVIRTASLERSWSPASTSTRRLSTDTSTTDAGTVVVSDGSPTLSGSASSSSASTSPSFSQTSINPLSSAAAFANHKRRDSGLQTGGTPRSGSPQREVVAPGVVVESFHNCLEEGIEEEEDRESAPSGPGTPVSFVAMADGAIAGRKTGSMKSGMSPAASPRATIRKELLPIAPTFAVTEEPLSPAFSSSFFARNRSMSTGSTFFKPTDAPAPTPFSAAESSPVTSPPMSPSAPRRQKSSSGLGAAWASLFSSNSTKTPTAVLSPPPSPGGSPQSSGLRARRNLGATVTGSDSGASSVPPTMGTRRATKRGVSKIGGVGWSSFAAAFLSTPAAAAAASAASGKAGP
ncbi:hypothetical protein HDU96_000872 [Phlyctochytrium bullatum]|nr:hypothetical protein HDU96_000872 [Phlyctochytrium bullatum]